MITFRQYLAEARLQPGNYVRGLKIFLDRVFENYPEYKHLYRDVRDVIIQSRCPKISLMPLRNIGGMAKTTEVIMNEYTLRSPFINFMMILFHEIAHQYQYSKHGEQIAMHIYKDNMQPSVAMSILRHIENAADRIASRMLSRIASKANVRFHGMRGSYNSITDQRLIQYIENVRMLVKQKKLTTIEQINNALLKAVQTNIPLF